MNKKVMKAAFVAAIAMVSGINVFNAQKSDVLSDTVLANVEALAELESGRVDCEPNGLECSMVVIYSDGCWGEDIVYGEKKKVGWL